MQARRAGLVRSGLLIKDFAKRHVLLTRIALGETTADGEAALSRFEPIQLEPSQPERR